MAQEDHDGWAEKIGVTDGREKLAQEDRDGWPRKLAQEDLDEWPRKLAQEDYHGWPRKLAQKHWANEHIDGLFGKLRRKRAELRHGLPGKIEKVVTHEQEQVEKVVT